MRHTVVALSLSTSLLLAACATQKVPMRAETRQSVKRIAIAEVPEPVYSMTPHASMATLPLLASPKCHVGSVLNHAANCPNEPPAECAPAIGLAIT